MSDREDGEVDRMDIDARKDRKERDRDRDRDRDRERDKDRDRDRRDKDRDRHDKDRDRRDRDRDRDRHKDSKPKDRKERRSRSRSRSRSPISDRREKSQSSDYVPSTSLTEAEQAGIPLATTNTNASGELECSIEETNRIRLALGLKPLEVGGLSKEEEEQKRKAREEAEKQRQQLEVQARILKSKKNREKNLKLQGKSLGEALSVQEGYEGAASWVSKSRTVEVEKQLAQKRAEQFDFQDEVHSEEEEEGRKKKGYGHGQLKGLKVGHKVDDFVEVAGDVVLTLRDAPILKDGAQLNDEDDELESIMIAEKERLKKKKEALKKKPIYDVYDDKEKSILAQYDEPKEQESFTLDGTGEVDPHSKKRLEEVKKKLALQAKQIFALDTEKKVASEYMTEQEMAVKFKKKKKEGTTTKKKAVRKKVKEEEPADINNNSNNNNNNNGNYLDEIMSNADNNNDQGSRDHGSRRRAADTEDNGKSRDETREIRDKNYAKAKEKAAEESKITLEAVKKEEDENEDSELSQTFSRVRELATQKKKKKEANSSLSIAERIQQAKQQQQQAMQEEVDPNLVFSSTTEFITRIQPMEELIAGAASSKSRPISSQQREKDSMEVDAVVEEDIAHHESMIREAAKKERALRKREEDSQREQEEKEREEEQARKGQQQQQQQQEENEDDDNTEESVLGEETPLVGLASALSFLRSRGSHETESLDVTVGRKNDRKPDLRPDNTGLRIEYRDEHGRLLTPKEAFRQLSHKFHGKKPGKNKAERRQKQQEEEFKRLNMSSTDTPLNSVSAMQQQQERSQQAFIVLSGSKLHEKAVAPTPSEPKQQQQQSSTAKGAGVGGGGGAKEGDFQGFKLDIAPAAKKQKK